MVAARAHDMQRVPVEGQERRHQLTAAAGTLIAERRGDEMQLQGAQHPGRLQRDDEAVDAAGQAPFDEARDEFVADRGDAVSRWGRVVGSRRW